MYTPVGKGELYTLVAAEQNVTAERPGTKGPPGRGGKGEGGERVDPAFIQGSTKTFIKRSISKIINRATATFISEDQKVDVKV